MATIAVIDYGMGNLHSVARALNHVAPADRIVVTQRGTDILAADRVVFPGQGAIRDCMRELARHNLTDIVIEAARNRPFLGLCLGPQALMERSEENGGVDGLGVLPGESRWFGGILRQSSATAKLKIPHMGWNRVHQTRPHALWEGIPQDSRFYFVHSYYLAPGDPALTAATTDYGIPFVSVIARDNLFAVQFHPEKSARWGLQLLANFSRWRP
ncbi:MAG: imidazole glycerol phosphate synthase subunit HisH [Candidatus Competibacterales bacterium]|nr:imidazole glycerol phosphate synthase subunit HisH [Candidatus Competibacterales bacterium]